MLMAAVASPVYSQSNTEDVPTQDGSTSSDSTTRLETITVEPTGEPETQLPLGTGISGKTLEKAPGSGGDPFVALQGLPGLVFTDDGEVTPAVRGSGPDDNYFEVDFVPTDYLFHVADLVSVYHPNLIDSFNVYPSAYGPEYAGVTGGVFDVRLRDPKPDRFHTTIDVSILQAGLLFEGPVKENQSFYVAGRLSYLDLIVGDDDDEDDEGIKLVQFPKYKDYQTKYVWDVSNDARITLQATGSIDEVALDIEEDADDIRTDPIIAGRLQSDSQIHQQALVMDTTFSDQVSVKSALAHSNFTEEFILGGAGTVSITEDKWIAKSHFNVALGESHDLKLGADITYTNFDLDLDFNVPTCTEFETDCTLTEAERVATTANEKITNGLFFIKDNWYVNDRLTVFPGITFQFDDYLDKSYVEPRFALEYSLSDTLTLSGGLGLYHQSPNIDQITQDIGNPDLDYIESTQAVVGLEKKFGDSWSVKSELYYKQLDGLVTGDDELLYANNGEGETYGLDTLVRKNLTDRFTGWLSLSLSDSTRTNKVTGEKFDFEFDQPINASLIASYKINKKWNFGAKYWVHSGALYTPVIGATEDPNTEGFYIPEYGPLNSERFPSYQRLDLRLDRTVTKKSGRVASVYLDVLNVLGTKNISYYEYNADYTEREDGEQAETNFALGYKTEF